MAILFGAYSQLAYGTPNHVYEDTLTRVLEPLLTGIYKHANASVQLFLTGSLMEWVESTHGAVNMLIADLSKMERLGELTGSFHQAVLPSLCQKDRLSQVEKTTTWISRNYHYKSTSFWSNWQFWSPSLIRMLNLARLGTVIISPYETKHGVSCSKHPFRMKELGKSAVIVPTDIDASKAVHDFALGLIAFKDLNDLLLQGTEDRCIMLNLDQLCQGGIASEEMGTLVDSLANLGTFSTVDEYVAQRPLGHDFLEEGVYGFDCNRKGITSLQKLLCKDEGLDYLYHRCMVLSETARQYKKDKDVRRRIEHLLTKLFCGAPYVMDANASMLRGTIRRAMWKIIIELERVLVGLDDFTYPFIQDVDRDGCEEILTTGKTLNAVVDSKCGALDELKYTPALCNLGDVESPPEGVSAEPSMLVPGKKQRLFADVLLPVDYDIASYCQADNQASCIVYSLEQLDRKHTEFGLLGQEGSCGLQFSKYYKFMSNVIRLTCGITNSSKEFQEYLYGLELPLSLFPGKVDCQIFIDDENEQRQGKELFLQEVHRIRLVDKTNNIKITLSSDEPFEFLKSDLRSSCRTTVGNETLYQATFLLPLFHLCLDPGATKELKVSLRVERN